MIKNERNAVVAEVILNANDVKNMCFILDTYMSEGAIWDERDQEFIKRFYALAEEINDIRKKEEKKNHLTMEVSFKGLDNIKNLIKVISDKCTEEGCINEYNNKLLTALLGDEFEEEYYILVPKRNAT